MLKVNKDKYDVVIIGAGIGGLVCGCYLAKAGMKVVIAEQHSKPGGYCTSFRRNGFTFDAAAHSLGGFNYGNIGTIFDDLQLNEKIKLKRFEPSNVIVTPDFQISFWNDLDKTIREFQETFPVESKNIKDFFSFIAMPNSKSSSGMKSLTFKNLLDNFFKDSKLKAVLSFPLFGNSGSHPSLISAFIGTKIFREFLIDGGYYPYGCMQALSDALAEKFKEFGGKIYLSCRAEKIIVKNNKTSGVVLKNGLLHSDYVVSNCDARQTFFKLLGTQIMGQDFIEQINSMEASLSVFILYLGIDDKYRNRLPGSGINLWILYHYDMDNAYLAAKEGNFKNIGGYLLHIPAGQQSILALMNAPFKNKYYWAKNKATLVASFIKRIEIDIAPDLSKHIKYKDAATPYTLYRYTSNYKGAAFGWACTPSQLAITDFRKPSFIQGLYLTGHWTTKGLGIPGVAYIGHDTAKMILRKKKVRID
jgi:phytoene dehydrogenase-like protein